VFIASVRLCVEIEAIVVVIGLVRRRLVGVGAGGCSGAAVGLVARLMFKGTEAISGSEVDLAEFALAFLPGCASHHGCT